MNKKKIIGILAVIIIILNVFCATIYAVEDETQNTKFVTVNQTVYAIGKVNVRKAPGPTGEKIGMLQKDESILRIGIGDNGWSKVKYNGEVAYVSTDYLNEKTVEELIETPEDPIEQVDETTEKSSVSTLKSMEIEEGKLVPEFSENITAYQIEVGADVKELKIEAVPEGDKAVVKIEGNEHLKEGENVIEVVVTAEDGTKTTYSVFVIKSDANPLALESLEIEGIELTPAFATDVYEYSIKIQNDTYLNIHAIANKEDATVEIQGNENLQEGENEIKIVVSKEDNMQTYILKVNREVKQQLEIKKEYIMAGVAAIIIIALAIIVGKASKKTKKKGRH